MKIAIHNEGGWNTRWHQLCKEWGISYKIVDCYDTNIMENLEDCDALMWSFDHGYPQDILMARNVLYSCEIKGMKVFPNHKSCWHFDDKITQKYLLESINAPLVRSWCFYNRKTAIYWLNSTAKYPLVAKLRRGAGSYNVKLLKNKKEAIFYCNKMFLQGLMPGPSYLSDAKNKLKIVKTFTGILKKIKKAPDFFKNVFISKHFFPKEKGYLYVQEFIPNNLFDIRVSIIGNKAWAFRRKVRENDFRASGSGMIDYDYTQIPLETIRISFEVSKRINAQSMAYDFVLDKTNKPYIVEMSYRFAFRAIYDCPGYWDTNLVWHDGFSMPEKECLKLIINS